MLIGLALIIVAVLMICALLFRLSIYALPLFVAFLAGSATYRGDNGIVAALSAAAIAAMILLAAAQLALAFAKSDLTRAAIGIAFATPAAIAGYYAVHGIATATMPQSAWQIVVSLMGSRHCDRFVDAMEARPPLASPSRKAPPGRCRTGLARSNWP